MRTGPRPRPGAISTDALGARTRSNMTITAPVGGFLLLLGLGFFFGIAFEEFNAAGGHARPGGVRSFPLLALAGALLYRLDPNHLLPLTGRRLVLGTARPPRRGGCE